MKALNRLINFFTQRQHLLYFIIFIIAVSLFTYLQFDSTFADPDSFYHAKMALILRDQGAITEFPWLSATTLRYSFTDHHFLYHLLLIPFVTIFPPLVGLKVATILFASLAIVVFYWFLKNLKVRGALWYALFLLTINPFIFRLNLAKAQALVLILLFLFLYCLFNRRYLSLIFMIWLYVWLYAGWPILLVVAAVYFVINWIQRPRQTGWLVIKKFKTKFSRQNLFLFLSVVVGLAAGIFFNPYFPGNLYFYWQQAFKIAVVNYQSVIGVGGEWYPFTFSHLLTSALPFFILFIFASVIFIYHRRFQRSVPIWTFLIISFLFFILTLKSRRNVEYFIPLALVFSALIITQALNSTERFWLKFRQNKFFVFLPPVIFLLLSPIFYTDLTAIKTAYQNGFSFEKFSQPAEWLRDHTPSEAIVFHSDWDEFPILFYHNNHNHYLVGLDPTFMYVYDKQLYRDWVALTTGKSNQNLSKVIKTIFGADYVFVDINNNAAFDRNLANNFFFEKVFENSEARIYRVIE